MTIGNFAQRLVKMRHVLLERFASVLTRDIAERNLAKYWRDMVNNCAHQHCSGNVALIGCDDIQFLKHSCETRNIEAA